ncbi:cytochrome P450 307a1 [Nilaparvata lugens]|uniref:cytochrome P450 307a1 n=1 Tax=Nilaparvata lugens TaxID=108931 RepID=UPI00193E6E3A|nr:cytochrome P450 307a1 [Nilaparvata lugens]
MSATTVVLLLLSTILALIRVFVKGFGHSFNGAQKLSPFPTSPKRRMPGPTPWPLIGDLPRLGATESPFQAFSALSRVYGEIYRLRLGTADCVVVSSFRLIKEVLISKGAHFGGRPDLLRFHALFGGDRNNSLALCDWSSLQKRRRGIARTYCSPRFASSNYDQLDRVANEEAECFIQHLDTHVQHNAEIHIKPLLLAACANMFSSYMCSTRFQYEDTGFRNMVRRFDEIFWEINQGYVVDFLPWLQPFYARHLDKLAGWTRDIRRFVHERVVEERVRPTTTKDGEQTTNSSAETEPKDFTDALLAHLKEDPSLGWHHILYELEDFLGGHSAVGNLAMLVLTAIVRNPQVGKKIQEEVDRITKGTRSINLFDKADMPYTEATILETLRTTSSPIVPHVATQHTTIADYPVKKGTIVFLNNYELNTAAEYWEAADEFRPERFISNEGQIKKPEFFIPFSTGKRTCIGQKLVNGFCFVLITRLLQHYDIAAVDLDLIDTRPACVALPPDSFPLKITHRAKVVT